MNFENKIKEIKRLIRLVTITKQISESDFDGAIENLYKKSIEKSSNISFANWLQLNCFLDRETNEWLLAEGHQSVHTVAELFELFIKENGCRN